MPHLPTDADFSGKKVLVVDDDVEISSPSQCSGVYRGMTVLYAENGKGGLKLLEENPDVNVVLMDTVMPEMGSKPPR